MVIRILDCRVPSYISHRGPWFVHTALEVPNPGFPFCISPMYTNFCRYTAYTFVNQFVILIAVPVNHKPGKGCVRDTQVAAGSCWEPSCARTNLSPRPTNFVAQVVEAVSFSSFAFFAREFKLWFGSMQIDRQIGPPACMSTPSGEGNSTRRTAVFWICVCRSRAVVCTTARTAT